MYIIVAKSCPDCNAVAIKLMNEKPSYKDIDEVKDSLGGMWCIHTIVKRVVPEVIVTGKQDE